MYWLSENPALFKYPWPILVDLRIIGYSNQNFNFLFYALSSRMLPFYGTGDPLVPDAACGAGPKVAMDGRNAYYLR
jgi:hypothetical protein